MIVAIGPLFKEQIALLEHSALKTGWKSKIHDQTQYPKCSLQLRMVGVCNSKASSHGRWVGLKAKGQREEEIGRHLGAAEEVGMSTAGAERMHPSKGKESPGMDPAGSEKREMAPKACGGGGREVGNLHSRRRARKKCIQQMQTAGGRDVWSLEKVPMKKGKAGKENESLSILRKHEIWS